MLLKIKQNKKCVFFERCKRKGNLCTKYDGQVISVFPIKKDKPTLYVDLYGNVWTALCGKFNTTNTLMETE